MRTTKRGHSRNATISGMVLVGLLGLATAFVCAAEWSGQAGAFSWQQPQAKVLPSGNLEWAPRPFVFEKGASVRYVDFEGGDDANDGLTKDTPWKHHPWDANAVGAAKAGAGIHTYVFKRGVVYRGALKADESGDPGDPIRLTSDPSWGEGEAYLFGSTAIRGGWQRAAPADAPGIPHAETVWYIDVGTDYDRDLRTPPSGDRDHGDSTKFSAMWQVAGGQVTRLHIARDPNYKLSDPNKPTADWHMWTSFEKVDNSNSSGRLTSPVLKGLGDSHFLDNALIWTEHSGLMGTVHKVAPKNYDPRTGSVYLASGGGANHSRLPRSKVHFFIENVAKFLDAPGEFFYDDDGPRPGRLYLRPADGVDPNAAVYEVAQIRFVVLIQDQSDIVVSGLHFRYNDTDDGTNGFTHPRQVSASPCVRVVGNCANITVQNCTFTHVANAVAAFPRPNDEKAQGAWSATYWWRGSPETACKDFGPFANDVMDNIIISDNDVLHAERAGAIFVAGSSESIPGAGFGKLKHVEVMRNRVVDTGFRPDASGTSSVPALSVIVPETCEIAGNIVDTSWGNGIFTLGGKGSGSVNTVPLTRMLVYQNQIDNTMLGCNDYGGLEHFQGGPIYIYNNITRNCVGNTTFTGGELGYSLYLDGGFKCYVFNNIIAGKPKPDQPGYHNHCGYFMVFGFMDQLFNNTIYRFQYGLDGSSGNRSNIVGNLMLDCSRTFIGQNRPGDVSMLGGGDTGEMGRMGIPTMAYASNVFFGKPTGRRGNDAFGYVAGTSGGRGAPVFSGNTLEELRTALEAQKCRLATIGWMAPKMPLADPANRDYRPTPDSAADGRGVKYFVPWAMARTVGEWNFYKSTTTPQIVLGEGFYMTHEYKGRGMYYFIPRNDLTVSQCDATDYAPGALEDWIEGALVFDGKDRAARLTHAEMTKDVEYGSGQAKTVLDGSKRETVDMGVNNFLIETVFRTAAGHAGGVLAAKIGPSGYELAVRAEGGVGLTLTAAGANATVVSAAKVNDGQWHHVVAEVDRAARKATIYVDGKPAGEGTLDALARDASLSNTADFVVGKGLAGAVDFLRVCRSTLAESKTSIEELYAWEFDGPALRDFRGVKPQDKRAAGAITPAR
jgi:concanavalin A-like lectin/glucanase superfamily protein